MEIKTCEEYVLKILEKAENDLSEAEEEIVALQKEVNRLTRVIDLLSPKLRKNYNGELEIDIDNICNHSTSKYSWYEESIEKYKEIVALLNLEYHEES